MAWLLLNNLFELPWAISLWHARLWYAVPLVVSISLVYGATRHENFKGIMDHAIRTLLWLGGFMCAIFVVIWVMGYWN